MSYCICPLSDLIPSSHSTSRHTFPAQARTSYRQQHVSSHRISNHFDFSDSSGDLIVSVQLKIMAEQRKGRAMVKLGIGFL